MIGAVRRHAEDALGEENAAAKRNAKYMGVTKGNGKFPKG